MSKLSRREIKKKLGFDFNHTLYDSEVHWEDIYDKEDGWDKLLNHVINIKDEEGYVDEEYLDKYADTNILEYEAYIAFTMGLMWKVYPKIKEYKQIVLL